MDQNILNSFNNEIHPNTPQHKKLKEVLYSVLAICFIVWAIAFVQIKSMKVEESISPPNTNELTAEQRQQAISELKEVMAKSTPVTDKERAKAIEELKKTIANQNK